MKEKCVAVVPVREGSGRIKDKNFIPFGGWPTLTHNKIAHLKESNCFDHIYISSDSPRAKMIAEEMGVEFILRDPLMCTSTPRWDEVVCHILSTIPGNPHVLWAMATSPLFKRYSEAVEQYFAHIDKHDSLVGVKKFREYFVDENCRPLFYSFGPWHPYSNELRPLYALNDTIFLAKKSLQLELKYWIGRTPQTFEGSFFESIDINFPEDLELAKAVALMTKEGTLK